MTVIPDSGEPGDELGKLKLTESRPDLLTEATWQHLMTRYQFRGELGQGGQACVFHMKELKPPNGRRAIKVYHENTRQTHAFFENECRILAGDYLPSELVVGYYECVSDNGIQPYIVLEFIDGETVTKSATRSMSVSERIDLWERVLRALHRLHQSNLVFGDLSPNNIMVQNDSRIRFVDLSGAKHLKKAFSGSQSSANIGTPAVMPESWNNQEVRTSLATDIFAISAIGFLILTGEPHSKVTPADRDGLLRSKEIPAAISRFVLRGLCEPLKGKLNDSSLYPSAEQIANDISHWRDGIEFAECHRLETSRGIRLYFADPGCPHQRGTNENTNGLLRQYFPKGTDFRTVSHAELRRVETLINNRPRACLGYKTPNDVFFRSQ